jgi:Family of unknown function (DUF6433)
MTTTTKKTTTSRKPTTAKKPTTRKTSEPKVAEQKIELSSSSYVHEILGSVCQQRTKDKKLEILRQYDENFIKSVLIWNFDESIQSVLPEGEVPLQPKEDADKVTPSSNIRKEWSKFYNFVKGGNDAMNKLRKETMFINMLESFHPGEAEILILVKDKKLQTKYNITKELVSEAYPDIQWGNRS